jgi:hypothetical protein
MDDFEIIHSYGSEDAIRDGVLVHPYPERWPNLLVTQSIHTDCKGQEGRTYDQALTPLLMDCILAVRANGGGEPPIVLEHTAAGTVWIMPNDLGGMTVMKPEDY